MSEFKAQILAILLVLGIFGFLNGKFQSFFSGLWTKVEEQLNSAVSSSSSRHIQVDNYYTA